MPNTIVHFEIPAENPEKLVDFYRDVLGWKFDKDESMDYWMVTTKGGNEPGANGGLYRRNEMMTSPINYYGVESIDRMVEKVEASGGTVKVPKMPIPGIGWMAHCLDPDGNLFGLFQEDRGAA